MDLLGAIIASEGDTPDNKINLLIITAVHMEKKNWLVSLLRHLNARFFHNYYIQRRHCRKTDSLGRCSALAALGTPQLRPRVSDFT